MTLRRALAFAEAGFPIFPVRLFRDGKKWRKKPHVVDWPNCATANIPQIAEWWERWPLAFPGIPLARCGFVVVDADRHPGKPDGIAALAALGSIPPHPVVATRGGGEHHYFAQPTPPIADNHALASAGIDVLGASRFVVGYDLAPLLAGPVPELPEVFRPKGRLIRDLDNVLCGGGCGGDARDVTAALRKLKPEVWNGKFAEWLALMSAAKFVGVAREDFIVWSIGDPDYAGDAEQIGRMWDRLRPRHGGTFFAVLKAAGIKVSRHHAHHRGTHNNIEVPLSATSASPTATPTATRNLQARSSAICATVERARGNAREPALFNAACTMAEIIAEGRLKPSIAQKLLVGAAQSCGLWKELGAQAASRTIANGLRHVEEKLLQSA